MRIVKRFIKQLLIIVFVLSVGILGQFDNSIFIRSKAAVGVVSDTTFFARSVNATKYTWVIGSLDDAAGTCSIRPAYKNNLISNNNPDGYTTSNYTKDGVRKYIGNVSIPSKVYCYANGKTYTPTSIMQYAFMHEGEAGYSNTMSDVGNTTLQSISSSTITRVNQYGFYCCSALTAYNFPQLTSVGQYAFNGSALTSGIGGTITSVGDHAYQNLSNAVLSFDPSYLSTVGDYAFFNCSNFARGYTFVFYNPITVGNFAFFGTGTAGATFQSGCVLGSGSFAYCEGGSYVSFNCSDAAQISLHGDCNVFDYSDFVQIWVVNNACYNKVRPSSRTGVPVISSYINIKFNINGGDTGSTNEMNIVGSQDIPLSANGFQKEGYNFTCWTNQYGWSYPDGYNAVAAGNNWWEMLGGNDAEGYQGAVTLYANWEIKHFNVVYDPNNGTVTDGETEVVYDWNSSRGEMPTVTREGYLFKGWYDANGNKASAADKIKADQTLTAEWEPAAFTLLLKDIHNGNSSDVYDYHAIAILPTPTYENFVFNGWLADDGTTVYKGGDSIDMVADVTLTAQWTTALGKANGEDTEKIVNADTSGTAIEVPENVTVNSTTIKKYCVSKFNIKNVKSKAIKVSFAKMKGAKGYQIQYSTSKKFTKKATKKVSYKKYKKSYKLEKLKKGKTYYVRVRSYITKQTTKDGKKVTKKIYSKYCKVKKVKIKK